MWHYGRDTRLKRTLPAQESLESVYLVPTFLLLQFSSKYSKMRSGLTYYIYVYMCVILFVVMLVNRKFNVEGTFFSD